VVSVKPAIDVTFWSAIPPSLTGSMMPGDQVLIKERFGFGSEVSLSRPSLGRHKAFIKTGIAGDRVQQFGKRPRQKAFAPGMLSQGSGVFPAWVLPHPAHQHHPHREAIKVPMLSAIVK
jgi:hypothetical protein